MSLATVVAHIEAHRCSLHTFFDDWAARELSPVELGALFHHLRHFCDATRPGAQFPKGLRLLGLPRAAQLMKEIETSEKGHGNDLAVMIGYIINRAAGRPLCPAPKNRKAVEGAIKEMSDEVFGSRPNYDRATGLLPEVATAKAVFVRRKLTDADSTYRNLGTALALEMLANRLIIPGEVKCLIKSKRYGAKLKDPEMKYLREHAGAEGAEAAHEKNAKKAIAPLVADPALEVLVTAGATALLDALAAMLDALDAFLLRTPKAHARRPRSSTASSLR